MRNAVRPRWSSRSSPAKSRAGAAGKRSGNSSGANGPTRVEPFTAASVAVGSLVQTNVPGAYFADGDAHKIFPFGVAGAISHAFFRSTEVTFDFDAMKMIVQKR
jgi:hypothetical protein